MRDWEIIDSLAYDHVKSNQLSKAASALISDPPVAVSPAVIDEMKSKHPEARDIDVARKLALRAVDGGAACQTEKESLCKAVRSFPKGSAGGTNGLRPQHLQDALASLFQHDLVNELAALCNSLLRGDIPSEVKPWFFGGKLAALPKTDGTLRPIAVGDTLRRLTSKLALEEVSNDIRSYLEPIQVGVGSKHGCERIVHVVRQWLARNNADKDKVLVSLDLANAFNTIDRAAIMAGVRRVCPSAAPWIDASYGQDSMLLLGETEIDSSRGVQQGDPVGPAVFALGIHNDILEAKAQTEEEYPNELDFVAFFLDDATAAGTSQAVKYFLDALLARLRAKGMEANVRRCSCRKRQY